MTVQHDHTADPALTYRNGATIQAEKTTWKLLREGLTGDELQRELTKAGVPPGVSKPIIERARG